jgi:hypothetical protein
MPATIQRWGKGLVALFACIALTACTIGREPAYDARLADEVTQLTAYTLRLFQDFRPTASETYADRAEQYRSLAGRAETIRLMAQARGSAVATSGLILRLARLGANVSLAEDVSPDAADRLAEYQDATPAYMTDYLRNLALLDAHDRDATGDRAERFAAYEAALARHEREMQAYLDAFGLWQAAQGPQPTPPAAPPQAPAPGLDPTQVALRRTALEDILRDTLVYERDILNRNR